MAHTSGMSEVFLPRDDAALSKLDASEGKGGGEGARGLGEEAKTKERVEDDDEKVKSIT